MLLCPVDNNKTIINIVCEYIQNTRNTTCKIHTTRPCAIHMTSLTQYTTWCNTHNMPLHNTMRPRAILHDLVQHYTILCNTIQPRATLYVLYTSSHNTTSHQLSQKDILVKIAIFSCVLIITWGSLNKKLRNKNQMEKGIEKVQLTVAIQHNYRQYIPHYIGTYFNASIFAIKS